jgi:hypothetical protein
MWHVLIIARHNQTAESGGMVFNNSSKLYYRKNHPTAELPQIVQVRDQSSKDIVEHHQMV